MAEKNLRDTVICKGCKLEFYDSFNLVCLGALDFCLKCANENVNKEDISKTHYGRS